VAKYGREGMCIKFEFAKNEYFENDFLVKALGKKRDSPAGPGGDGSEDWIGFCEFVTPIKWKDEKLAKELINNEESESLNGEDLCDNMSFFNWLTMNASEKETDLDDEGCDKFSKAIVEDLWNDPMVWYVADDDDSDDSDDDEEFVPEEDMD